MKVEVFRSTDARRNGEEHLLLVGPKDGGRAWHVGYLTRMSKYPPNLQESVLVEVNENEVPIRLIRYIRRGRRIGLSDYFILQKDENKNLTRGPSLVKFSSGVLRANDGRMWYI